MIILLNEGIIDELINKNKKFFIYKLELNYILYI